MTGVDPAVEALAGCVFCRIAAGEAPAEVVSRYHRTIVFEPLNPVTPGHLLVVPHMHVRDAAENSSVTAETFGVAAQEAKRLGGDFNLITSGGEAATQTVFHLHVHLVPRRESDGLALPWTLAADREPGLRAAVEALHVRRDGPVYAFECTEGDCDHTAEEYDGEWPSPECPQMADAVCAHCADQTEPGEAWEHVVRPDAFWPCATIRAVLAAHPATDHRRAPMTDPTPQQKEPDGLRAAIEALACEWERNYASMLIGGFSGCSIGADTAAKRLRALLAAHPATDQPEVRR